MKVKMNFKRKRHDKTYHFLAKVANDDLHWLDQKSFDVNILNSHRSS